MSEEYSIADSKQTDFALRVDAQTEDSLRPDSPCPSGLSAWPCHGWDPSTRLHQYVNYELPDVQAGFRKGRGTGDQIANICWVIVKSRKFLKNIYFYFIDYTKAFDCVDHNKLWKILKEMGIPDHLTCLLRNLYAGQEANSYSRTWNNRLVPNRKRSMSRLYIVALLI